MDKDVVRIPNVIFSSVTQSCPTLCEPVNRSTPGLPVHHQLPEFTQTHVHQVGDAIQPSHPLSSPSPPAPNPSQHQRLYSAIKGNIFESVLMRWMNLEPIKQSEVSQKEKDKYYILELTPRKDVFHYRGLDCKVGSQETPRVTGKFGLGMQNEAGQRLTEFCQENALVIANTLFQQHKR